MPSYQTRKAKARRQPNRILSIDRETATVEPGVTMEQLVRATLPHAIPQVVPEFRHITVGGAIMGGALESSSHKYGQFNDTCVHYLTDHGPLTPDNELFFALAGSYGTLCTLTQATIRLQPAAPSVEITYSDQFDFTADFVDGIIDNGQRIIMNGHLSDQPSRPFHGWFYKKRPTLIPLEQYLFRYDPGCFWMGRYIWPWPLPSRFLYWGLHHLPKHPFFIQDAYLPPQAVLSDYKINPTWLCPIKATQTPQIFSAHKSDHPMLVNYGLYGVSAKLSQFECEIRELGGRKMLYGDSTYTPDTFWSIYDRAAYIRLGGSPSVLEKKLLKTQLETAD